MATILIESFADAKYKWYPVTDSAAQHHHRHPHRHSEGDESPNHTHRSRRVGESGASESEATFSIENGVGTMDGEVKVVEQFSGPGFLSMKTGHGNYLGAGGNVIPDVSSCTALQLVARSAELYEGYRVSFGSKYVPFLIPRKRGFKANFDLPAGETTTVTIPFNQFSLFWDGATGDALVPCSEKTEYCPDEDNLKNMKTISIWAQGVAGKVHLEVESISATGCGSSTNTSALIELSSSSSGSKHILTASAAFIVIVGFVFALVRRRRNTRTEYQGMDRFLVDCPETLIPVQTPGTVW